jgi:hypothetical protein
MLVELFGMQEVVVGQPVTTAHLEQVGLVAEELVVI